jgi:hypothetical protein
MAMSESTMRSAICPPMRLRKRGGVKLMRVPQSA